MTLHPTLWLYAAGLVACAWLAYKHLSLRAASRIPLLRHVDGAGEKGPTAPLDFVRHARGLLHEGRKQFPNTPYRLTTNVGEAVVLPSSMAHDIRNEPNLSFREAFALNFHPHTPGFDGFAAGYRSDELLQRVVKKWITKLLNQVTEPLAVEADHAVKLQFESVTEEWSVLNVQPVILDMVARLSSRVFLGEEVCRDEKWLAITKSYTVLAFGAATSIRDYPSWARPIVHWFDPVCQQLRQQVRDAADIIKPVLQARRDIKRQAVIEKRPLPAFNDAIDWFEQESRDPYDAVGMQLGLSIVAIHTTTDLVLEALSRIAADEQLLSDLRQEAVSVLSSGGWQKSALVNLKLLDSVLKETQRLKPITSVMMNRVPTKPVTLPDGTVVYPGQNVVVDIGSMRDPDFYDSPETFDGYRFLHLRDQPGKETQVHLVSTSSFHMGFGHGLHACPGRFFAANEAKVILAKLLMEFDWRSVVEGSHLWEEHGFAWSADSSLQLRVRRVLSPATSSV